MGGDSIKIYLISGMARHGKDTIGNFIEKQYKCLGYKTCKSQISKYLKVYIKDYFGWDGEELTKPRELLQVLGTDIIIEKMNKPNFLINRTIEDIEILSHFFDVMIITDIRFPLEINLIKENFKDVVSINVKRINFDNGLSENESNHKTETALIGFDKYDYKLINDTLEKLEKDVIDIVMKEENNAKIN